MSNIQKCKGKEFISYTVKGKRYRFPLNNSFGSHLPLLLDIWNQADIKTALEIGCGEHSTPILAQADLEIVEQGEVAKYDPQYVEWVRKNFPDARIHIAIGKDEWKKIRFRDHYDIVFVDCYEYSRVEIANWAQDHTDIIVLHDTEPTAVCYGWQNLKIPWRRFDYTDFMPNSTVFYRKDLVL